MKRVISAILGIGLIGVVVFLGIKSGSDSIFVIPFGIASALIAPIGISALGYSVKKEDLTLKKLALVPEIDDLIEKAETEAEKIKRLKKEKAELLRFIQKDTKRIALVEKSKILEADIHRNIDEYEKVMLELAEIEGEKPDLQGMSSEIRKFYTNKTEIGFTIFGDRYVVDSIGDFYNLPAAIIVNSINKLVMSLMNMIQNVIDYIVNRH
uniref:hypothetical protein n=1 Tax=Agathobacter sp. TaxID=2021311 RepID=UPI0040282E08